MKKDQVVKLLIPGVIMGFVLGSIIGYLAGVDANDVMKNNIGGMAACLIPCLLNCTIVVKQAAGVLNRKISVLKAFTHSIPEIIAGAVIGLLFHAVILAKVLNINTCTFSRIGMTALNMILGIVVSTIMGYIAIRTYESKVKYTKRNK